VVLCFPFSIGENYYELLGVPKNANNIEIRRAFKRLAVTMHPDKNQVCLY
jgi:curved DNA-binding protein CbpA